jgi:glycosyltransferase involved in cell wall biosynthesis
MIDALRCRGDFHVDSVSIKARARSLKRYVIQFAIYPFLAWKIARSYSVVVLYQEDLGFLVPFVRIGGGRACVIVHHLGKASSGRRFLELVKDFYITLLRRMIARADLILTPSEVSAREIEEKLPSRAGPTQVIPNPFDGRYVRPPTEDQATSKENARTTLEKKFGVRTRDAFLLLNVGSEETRKNNATLLRGLSLMKDCNVVFLRVGDAVNRANRIQCEEIARRSNNGLTAYFIDRVSDDDLRLCYNAADAYASASLIEGFGRTVIEAQQAGLPVIASDIQIYRDTMGSSFFSVSDPRDPVSWAQAVARFVHDRELAAALAMAGKHNSTRFSSEAVAEVLSRTLQYLIENVSR